MLEIHPLLLLYQGVIFIVFAFLMWKFVYKSLVKMVEDRRRRIEENIQEAERKRSEAEALRTGFEVRVAELDHQADEIVRKAEAEGQRRLEELVQTGRAEAAKVAENTRRQAELDIEQTFVAAKGELAGLAADLARKALGKTISPEVDEKLIADLSQELGNQEWKA
jgi:F-type H+-transporting ATPase subunit b